MAMGHFRREWVGYGTAALDDVFSGTLPLTSGWEIKQGSVKIWAAPISRPAYSYQFFIADDSGGAGPTGNIAGQGVYADVQGDLNRATGEYEIRENNEADNPFTTSDGCWIEYYEYNASVADDYDGAWANYAATDYPLILTKYAHSAFASNNLSNHGTNCLLVRQQNTSDHGRIVLWKKGLETYQAIMSQVACRPYQDADWRIGPSLLQRAEDVSSLDRWGYELKAVENGGVLQFIAYSSNGATPSSYERVMEDAGVGVYCDINWRASGARSLIKYVDPANGTHPIPADDWHILRFITTVEKDDDVHLHALIARGSTEVDKASPTFDTLFDAWHISGLTSVENFTTGVVPDVIAPYTGGNWGSITPHALPPLPGRAGLVIGGQSGRADSRCAFDSLAIHPMPGP